MKERRKNSGMELVPLGIEGVWLAESPVWIDDRDGKCSFHVLALRGSCARSCMVGWDP